MDLIEYSIEKSWYKFNPKLTRIALEVIQKIEDETPKDAEFKNGFNKCWLFQQIMHSIELKTPMGLSYYWYRDGVVVDPETLTKITKGIIQFRWDKDCIGCQIETECPCIGNPNR